MSTEIYNAYKIENCSFTELNERINHARHLILNDMRQSLHEFWLKCDLYFYFLKTIDNNLQYEGRDSIVEILRENTEEKDLKKIYDAMLEDEDYSERTKVLVRLYAMHLHDNYNPNSQDLYPVYPVFFEDFCSCRLMTFPYKNGFLILYFGNEKYQETLIKELQMVDWHYQNQSDRPSDVSAKEWRQREKDWDTVIGPDYIPTLHGPVYNLGCGVDGLDANYILVTGMLNTPKFDENFVRPILNELSWLPFLSKKKVEALLKDELKRLYEFSY